MHPDQLATRYTPTSPLSPRIPQGGRPLSPQPTRSRANHSRQTSRNMNLKLPRYHPANYQSPNEAPGFLSTQTPPPTYQRHTQQTQFESPRMMRERQRELIDRARMSSQIAASPMGIKPEQPRLDPLGSPKGPVTPLALEEAQDYFQITGAGRVSPARSPGAISNGSIKDMDDDEDSEQSKKMAKIDMYR